MHSQVEILLIEDNAQDAELTIRAIRKYNSTIKVLHLKDGVEAIDFLLKESELSNPKILEYPKAILLDLKMPKLDGIEVLKIIKSAARLKHLPVIMFTSSKENPDVEKCFRAGANSYIVKPVEIENLVDVVKNLVHYWVILNHQPI